MLIAYLTLFGALCITRHSNAAPIFSTHTDREVAAESFENYMRGNGYSVDRGKLVYWDLEKCQQEGGALKCFGNNPDSPYGINSFLNENAVDGEYTKDLDINIERRFRADEAIVFFGLTPPEAKYIGYTHYLSKRRFGRSKRINASLGDTINHLNINVTGDGSPGDTFNSDVCIVTTADQNMFDAIATGMLSVGVPSDSMNLQVLAKDTLQLGLTKHHDSISWLNRIVRFADKEAGTAYMANPPVFLFRITPLTEKEIAPYPIPIRKTRKTGQNENYMWYTIERLERTLRKVRHWLPCIFMIIQGSSFVTCFFYSQFLRGLLQLSPLVFQRFDRKVRTSYINPSSKVTATFGETCLKKEKNCKRDNSDAAYFFNYPARNMGPNELLIIYGVSFSCGEKRGRKKVGRHLPTLYVVIYPLSSPVSCCVWHFIKYCTGQSCTDRICYLHEYQHL